MFKSLSFILKAVPLVHDIVCKNNYWLQYSNQPSRYCMLSTWQRAFIHRVQLPFCVYGRNIQMSYLECRLKSNTHNDIRSFAIMRGSGTCTDSWHLLIIIGLGTHIYNQWKLHPTTTESYFSEMYNPISPTCNHSIHLTSCTTLIKL